MSSTTTPSKKAIRKAKVSSTAKRAAEVTTASDDAITVQVKSKKTLRPTEVDDEIYSTESTDVSDVEVREKVPKKSKTNSIEAKTIDALKNAATAVIFMNLFTIHCSQNGVEPTLKTIMDNGAASNELFQLLQPTHNESVKNIEEGGALKKLIHRNFISKTLVPFKTDYEAANTKVVEAINHRNCYSAQDVIKNIEAIMSYHNCREAFTELVLNNADKFSRRRPSDSASNTDEKFPLKKNHATPNHNSNNRNSFDAQADKIRAAILPEIRKDSKVDLKKIRSSTAAKINTLKHL
ncbi:hypothetical protein DDB_G0277781 [Dictyostelium discoideum AX4]|uniref:Uncharacterized protein n=1 Tax=Dictyostelium discoideum TaxID=44689 RepID=Q54Z47_DICDI|nr:hypothetical protein DDB_G0277781 [Dictyostelium discoideum AX4]EAL68564.1 hypothetical protein DDB_G0277781 [Dictyostelium discoideum AX4]|eukprot:XP_642506.1 hypothetical protein DDB_G0277781 [Dictyostelium discoideum AX4]